MTHRTLTDLFAMLRDSARGVTFNVGEGGEHWVSDREVYERALCVLGHLQDAGARVGDPMILCVDDDELFLVGFWAALAGGLIPVPVNPPLTDEQLRKLSGVARKLVDPFFCVDSGTLGRLAAATGKPSQQPAEQSTGLALCSRAVAIDRVDYLSAPGVPHQPGVEDVALIQFSSGSTGQPKGVVLTHANLLANIRQVTQVAGICDRDVCLSWMPLTHDMGLIGMYLMMLTNRVAIHLMRPRLFARRPGLWLTLATKKRATILSSPNFGFRHCLKALRERVPREVDLNAVRLVFNGAEPISADLCRTFIERLSPYGLSARAMYPVYGLAEASLAVSFPAVGSELNCVTLDRSQLGVAQAVRQLPEGHPDGISLVSLGHALPEGQLRLASDSDEPVVDGHVGHIQIRGPHVTSGYFADPDANTQLFAPAGWLRTGDLGVLIDGELFVTGRTKELIILNGQNHYPQDLEAIAEQVPGLEAGKIVAAGCRLGGKVDERLVFFVQHRGSLDEFVSIAGQLSSLVTEQTGLATEWVLPVRAMPRTTSGKLQRNRLQREVERGEFNAVMDELDALRATRRDGLAEFADGLARELGAMCTTALGGRPIKADDNLFEIGATSLNLAEIHEQIDGLYPGLIDLSEIFDFPTIALLASTINARLEARAKNRSDIGFARGQS